MRGTFESAKLTLVEEALNALASNEDIHLEQRTMLLWRQPRRKKIETYKSGS